MRDNKAVFPCDSPVPVLLVDIGRHSLTTRRATEEDVIRWLIHRATEADQPNLRYWEPTEEYPTQHHFMWEGVMSDE